MLSVGPLEMVVIALVALIAVGPQKLPELMRQIGRLFIQAKRATADVRSQIDELMRDAEASVLKEEHEKLRRMIDSEIKQINTKVQENITDDHRGDSPDESAANSGYEESPHYDPAIEAADQASEEASEGQASKEQPYEPTTNASPKWDTDEASKKND